MARRRRNRKKIRRAAPYTSTKISNSIKRYISNGKYGKEIKTADFVFSGQQFLTWYNVDADVDNYCGLPINSASKNIQAINLITQGPGIFQRMGDTIKLKSARIRLGLRNTTVDPSDTIRFGTIVSGKNDYTPNFMALQTTGRLMLIYDKFPSSQSTYPQIVPNILSIVAQDGTLVYNEPETLTFASLDVNSLERYTVLMDKILLFPGLGPFTQADITDIVRQGPTSFKEPYLIDEFIKLRELKTIYNGTSAHGKPITINYIVTGGLYIVSYGSNYPATEPYYWAGVVRVRFLDDN